ncbi:MAG: haloacid dehalogenase-like hydrolase, partial [Verrucomicrobiota bacterium]
MNAILLFDIDGTLVDTEGAGLRALRRGLHDAFPATAAHSFPSLDLGGATDGGVIAFLFSHFSIENSSENRVEFYAAYEGALSDELYRSREAGRGRVLPGVADLLRHLEQNHDDKGRGLLTGNSENGARIKLQHFGIDGPFSFGAFGDDHHDRNRLGPIALDRAAKTHGREFSG